MGKYLYQARTEQGQFQTGQMDALDELDVNLKLKQKSLTPTRVVLVKGDSKGFSFGTKRASSRDIQIFTRQFSTLIDAGIPIVDALKILGEGKRNIVLKEAAIRIRNSIEQGKRLAESMGQMPHVFDRFYVNMVRAGEEAGILDGILGRLAIYMEKSEKIKKQVKGAMVYPAMIVFVAIIVVTGILVFIIPKFQELYNNAGKELPGMTKAVIALSDLFVHRWYVIVGVLVGGPIALVRWYRTPEGKKIMDRILIRSPLFGDLTLKSALAKTTRTLATLLTSGVGVLEAIEIAARTAGNSVIEEILLRSRDSVSQGRAFAHPLIREKIIPDMVTQMISIGEQTGNLDTMLSKIADFYEDDVENAVKALTSLVEPILMVVLGGVIACLVLAMYLPIFDMASVAGGK